MKFTPKEITGNVNVSKSHPLSELSWLVGGLLGLLALIYLVLGLVTDLAAEHIPLSAEKRLGQWAMAQIEAKPHPGLQRRVEVLLQQVPADSEVRRTPITVYLLETEDINAMALPGGNIVVFRGLIDAAQSENELAMVLAHELGHIVHRDNLRGMGRGLGMALAGVVIFGPESSIAEQLSSLFMGIEARYSREQESAADDFALDLLQKTYGHVGEATAFFDRIHQLDKARPPALFASHPNPQARIERLRKKINAAGYPVGTAEPIQRNDFK